MNSSSPFADLQGEALPSDDEALTDTEVELLELYESMSEENQKALTRIALLLELHPEDEPLTKEKLEELFLRAKSLQ
jgi:hypothetical protein